jgi:hypothetical protein
MLSERSETVACGDLSARDLAHAKADVISRCIK